MCISSLASPRTTTRIAVNHAAMLLILGVQCAAAPPQANATGSKPFIDCGRDELVQAIPELAGIQFETSQDHLDGLLQAAGEKLQGMFAKLVSVSADEEIHEMRFEDTMVETSRSETFQYVVRVRR